MFFPRVFGMFLLGFYAGRRRIFGQLDEYAPLLRKAALWGFLVGLPLAFIGASFEHAVEPTPPSMAGLAETIVESIGTPALSLAYAASICLLYRRFSRRMRILAPGGRMALTNYLMHSVAGIVIFYGIGFGSYGHVSLTIALAGCVAFYALQIVLSGVWLSAAQFGPVEWLWRMLRPYTARDGYWTFTNWMSNTRAALGGMGPLPDAPYASDGGTMIRRTPPTFIPVTPVSKPLMIVPAPTMNANELASNCCPLWSAAVSL